MAQLVPQLANSSGVGDQMDLVLTDMALDPDDPRLLHTDALCGRSPNIHYDNVTEPTMPTVYVGFAGRSVVQINELRPVVIV